MPKPSDNINVKIELASNLLNQRGVEITGIEPPILERLIRFMSHVGAYKFVAFGLEEGTLAISQRRRAIHVVLNGNDLERVGVKWQLSHHIEARVVDINGKKVNDVGYPLVPKQFTVIDACGIQLKAACSSTAFPLRVPVVVNSNSFPTERFEQLRIIAYDGMRAADIHKDASVSTGSVKCEYIFQCVRR